MAKKNASLLLNEHNQTFHMKTYFAKISILNINSAPKRAQEKLKFLLNIFSIFKHVY